MDHVFNGESQDLFLSQEIESNRRFLDSQMYNIHCTKFGHKRKSTAQQINSLNSILCTRTNYNDVLEQQRHTTGRETIKFIWCSEYSAEIIESLKEVEKRRKKIHYKSPQKEFRASLVEVIKCSAEILQLGRTTVHLAVYLLDVFMDTYAIIQNKLNAVALTCLLLASKIEERDSNIPKLERLGQICRLNSIGEFKKAEVRLLRFFEWYLLYPTGATYLEYYISNFLSKKDTTKLLADPRLIFITENEIITEANSLVFEILDLTLQDQSLVQTVPSITAAACLAATRTFLGLYKWDDDMLNLTGYKFYEIEKTYESLLHLKRKKDIEERNKSTPDSGFWMSSDSESDSGEHFSVSCKIKRRRMS